MKKRRTQTLDFAPTLTTRSPLKMAAIKKRQAVVGKASAIGLSKFVKIKALSPLTFPEFNAESIGTNFKSQKWKINKLATLFQLPFFILRPIWLNEGFSTFLKTILDRQFLPSQSEAENLPDSEKKNFFCLSTSLLINFFYMWTKFRLKSRVTTVHLLQCKTNFLIYLCFWGRNLQQIKEHPSWEGSINIKKKFFDSFTLVYICLHSSTFVYTRLVTRLHSSTFVYTRLHLSSDSSVFRTDRKSWP